MASYLKIELKLSDNKVAQLSENILSTFEINQNEKILLCCGHKEVSITITSIKEQNCLYCNIDIYESLYLPHDDLPIRLYFNKKTKRLTLGPIIGLLVDKFPQMESFCNEFARYCMKQHALFYVFSKQTWDNHSGYYVTNEEWKQMKLPKPTAIYNRIHSRLYEKSGEIQQLFQTFQQLRIPFYNDHFLNKWEVYDILSAYPFLSPYVPETKLMNGFSTLSDMAATHNVVFIKPVHGSLGKGIFRITRRSDKLFILEHSSMQEQMKFSSLETLYSSLRERLLSQRYIIQQGISLLTDHNRPVDFRLLCHRNEQDKWDVISAVARISEKQQFVSNIAKGGEMKNFHSFLAEQFAKEQAYHIRIALYELAIEVATLLGKNIDGYFAELGVDLAVDTNGKPWLLEVNTKPSKLEEQKSTIRPSTKAIVQHCIYLSALYQLSD